MNKFDIKDKLDGLIYGSYNFISEILFMLNYDSRNAIKKNKVFKDIHAGKRCFILGTGPSLNQLEDHQIDILKREIVFGVNSLYKSEIGDKITPSYYALLDNLYWEQWNKTFTEISNKYKDNLPVFITDLRAKHLVEEVTSKNAAVYIYSKKYPAKKVSADLDRNIYGTMNVVSFSILSAMYMGFSEIYLLGCDYSAFCTQGKGHCYDDKSELSSFNYNLAFYLRFYWMITEFHYLIAKLAKDKKIKVINLTPDSLLDAYPRHKMSSIL